VTTVAEFSELIAAFEFASFGGGVKHRGYVDRMSGKIYCVSDDFESEEELPDDLEESDRYLAVPDKNELDLGRRLVDRFILERLPDAAEQVRDFFQRKGAYSRLKVLLADRGLLEQWYEFEQAETKAALREWCGENDIELADAGAAGLPDSSCP
jgi:hypothetical protein